MLFHILRMFTIVAATVQTAAAITIIAGLAIMILSAFGAVAKPAGGPVTPMICKPVVTAKAVGKTSSAAKNKAIAKWKSIATSIYGSSFADIDKAKMITMPIGFSNGKWWVIVKAKPCKSIGFGLKREFRGIPKQYRLPLRPTSR